MLSAITRAGHTLIAELPAPRDIGTVAAKVRGALRDPRIEGVVLLGGYDVVPSQRRDCLPVSVRGEIGANDDLDNYIIWSDDVYGDKDGDEWPELPVSRVPDAKSTELFLAAMSAPDQASQAPRFGVRNFRREFARSIFGALPGNSQLLDSQPTLSTQAPPYDAYADRVYIMLHGAAADGSRFWGEPVSRSVAMTLDNIPRQPPRVVFTGCCWGGLIVDTLAVHAVPGRPIDIRTPERSLALSFLSRGVTGFVGCTGSHYSPSRPPFDYAGAPMHASFWQAHAAGKSPARALFEAKTAYKRDFPHGRTTVEGLAAEYKILREFTCLGLGW